MIFAVAGTVSAAWFVVIVIDSDREGQTGLFPLGLLLFAVLGFGAGAVLDRVPSAIEPRDGFFVRLRKRACVAAYWAAVLVTLALAGLALHLTIRGGAYLFQGNG